MSNLKGVEVLTEDEAHFCSIMRIRPEDFIKSKQTLISESKKNGALKRSSLLKITPMDANKFYRVFDFLVYAQVINGKA